MLKNKRISKHEARKTHAEQSLRSEILDIPYRSWVELERRLHRVHQVQSMKHKNQYRW